MSLPWGGRIRLCQLRHYVKLKHTQTIESWTTTQEWSLFPNIGVFVALKMLWCQARMKNVFVCNKYYIEHRHVFLDWTALLRVCCSFLQPCSPTERDIPFLSPGRGSDEGNHWEFHGISQVRNSNIQMFFPAPENPEDKTSSFNRGHYINYPLGWNQKIITNLW